MYRLLQPPEDIHQFWIEKRKKDLDELNRSSLNKEYGNLVPSLQRGK
jgi:hypothetical protein